MKLLTITTTLIVITAQTAQAIPTIEEVNNSFKNYISTYCWRGIELEDISKYQSEIDWANCRLAIKSFEYCNQNNAAGSLARKECLIWKDNTPLINSIIIDN